MGFKYRDGLKGVTRSPLKVIEDERGAVMHMMRNDHPMCHDFGEIYFSKINHGFLKGWKRHKKMTQNFTAPFGQVTLIILDLRDGSDTYDHYTMINIGHPAHYQLVTIEPNLWYAFFASSQEGAILANFTDLPHDPLESEQLPIDHFHVEDIPSSLVS